MKLTILAVSVALAGVLFCAGEALNQGVAPTSRSTVWPAWTNRVLPYVQSNQPVIVFTPSGASTSLFPPRVVRTNRLPYAPGVYYAKPYSMAVVVPGPHPDDKCLFWPGQGMQMPTIKPELQLVPKPGGTNEVSVGR